MMSPVDCRAPKANAIKVTLKIDMPFKPAFETPIKKDAVKANTQEEVERSMVESVCIQASYRKNTHSPLKGEPSFAVDSILSFFARNVAKTRGRSRPCQKSNIFRNQPINKLCNSVPSTMC